MTGIYDHHSDSGAHQEASERVIDPSLGSACTLVAEQAQRSGIEVRPEGQAVRDRVMQRGRQ